MMIYGFPPGYNPHHPRSATTAAPPAIPANVLARARAAGATHISRDGKRAYVKRCNNWYEMRWLDVDFGCWWSCDQPGEMDPIEPTEIIES